MEWLKRNGAAPELAVLWAIVGLEGFPREEPSPAGNEGAGSKERVGRFRVIPRIQRDDRESAPGKPPHHRPTDGQTAQESQTPISHLLPPVDNPCGQMGQTLWITGGNATVRTWSTEGFPQQRPNCLTIRFSTGRGNTRPRIPERG